MASPEMKFVISATDHASAVLGGVGKNVDSLNKKTKALADAGRMLGAGAILAFGAASLKAYSDAEQSQVKLQEAYRKFPAIANVSIESLRAYNAELERKTSTDADQIAAAQATLAQFALTGDQIKSVTPLMVDYARATGTDVTSAAGVLGKALMGNARALKSIGIDFKSTGDRGKDFETIMGALEEKVGGAGEAFRGTAAGDMEQMRLQFENLQEEVGAQLVPALSKLVDVAVPVLQAFGRLPEPVKSVGVAMGGVVAAALFLGPKLIATAAHLGLIGPAGAGAAGGLAAEGAAATAAGSASAAATPKIAMLGKALGPIAIGITATVAAMEGFQFVLDRIGAGAEQVNGLADAMKNQNAEAVESSINAYKAAQATGSWQSALALLVGTGGAGFPLIVQGFRNAGDATANLDEQLSQMVSNGDAKGAADIIALLGLNADEAKEKFPGYAKAIAGTAGGLTALGDSADGAVDGLSNVKEEAKDTWDVAKELTKATNDLKSALDELGGKAISVDGATAGLQAAYDDAAEAAKTLREETDKAKDAVIGNGIALDLGTEAGRTAQGALEAIATKADDVATAMDSAGASTAKIRDKMVRARDEFVKNAEKMGLTRQAAERLADKYGLIPDRIATEVQVKKDAEAKAKAEELRRLYGSVPGHLYTYTSLPTADAAISAAERVRGAIVSIPRTWSTTVVIKDQNGNNVRVPVGVSTGGYIRGAGTGTSDSIPARLSNGEYVIRAASVARAGVAFLDDLNDNGMIDNVAITAGGRAIVSGARDRAQAQSAQFWSHTVLQVDGKQLAESLVKYKRSIGNAPLGVS